MIDDPNYEPLAEDPWDTYRDLNKVFADDFCKKNSFDQTNTLLVDSDQRKVQFWLQNSITDLEYTKDDVNKKKRLYKDQALLLDDEWHRNHLNQLAEFIIEMLDNCDNVPDYLQSHTPADFLPKDLLASKASSDKPENQGN